MIFIFKSLILLFFMNQINKRLDILRRYKDILYDYLYENMLGFFVI